MAPRIKTMSLSTASYVIEGVDAAGGMVVVSAFVQVLPAKVQVDVVVYSGIRATSCLRTGSRATDAGNWSRDGSVSGFMSAQPFPSQPYIWYGLAVMPPTSATTFFK